MILITIREDTYTFSNTNAKTTLAITVFFEFTATSKILNRFFLNSSCSKVLTAMNIFCNWLKWPLEVLEYRLWPPVEYTLCFCWFTKMREIQIIDVGYWKFKLFLLIQFWFVFPPRHKSREGVLMLYWEAAKNVLPLMARPLKGAPPPPD